MSSIKVILAELLGLFVDDGSFAGSIVVCLGLAWILLPRLPSLGPWAGVVLFVGLAGMLVGGALRRARR